MSEQPPKPEPGGEPGSGATAARRLYSCGNGDCIGSDAHREEVRKEGAREMREKAAMLLMRWVTSERGVLSLEPVELACLIRALPLTPEAPEPPKSDSGISSDAKSESIPVPEPPGAEKGSGCAYCIPAQPCPDHRPAPSPPTAEELACHDCKEYRLMMVEKMRRLVKERDEARRHLNEWASAEPSPCVVCAKPVCTNEDGCDGSELTDGGWVCSEACWDKATEEKPLPDSEAGK